MRIGRLTARRRAQRRISRATNGRFARLALPSVTKETPNPRGSDADLDEELEAPVSLGRHRSMSGVSGSIWRSVLTRMRLGSHR